MISTAPTRPYDIVAALVEEFIISRQPVSELRRLHRRQWELEDASRAPDASAERVGVLKGEIDASNSRRHRLITAIDEQVAYRPADGASRYYSETIGELCDRLIILDLKHQALTDDSTDSVDGISRHLAVTANQLVEHTRRGVAVLPPRVGLKIYRRDAEREMPRQRRRLRTLITSRRSLP
ncbi:DUF4254 domain-containing protein [Pilimelia columellifera]